MYYETTNGIASNDCAAMLARFNALATALSETRASYIERLGGLANDVPAYEHAWYYANEHGGYIICSDEGDEGSAIEDFGQAFGELGWSGLYHEPEELLKSGLTMADIEDAYYPYNGGEAWIDMPVIIRRIY